ncbi:MAG: SRPBCC family protein [Halobacteriaceae archaeon]
MQTVTVSRHLDADPDEVRALMDDLEAFMLAAGFDGVTVDGDDLRIENGVGLATIELDLELVERPGADLAYVQRDGIFREMETRYVVEPSDGGAEVRATTEFALDVDLVGFLLDATVVKRQRTHELESQFDYLESQT